MGFLEGTEKSTCPVFWELSSKIGEEEGDDEGGQSTTGYGLVFSHSFVCLFLILFIFFLFLVKRERATRFNMLTSQKSRVSYVSERNRDAASPSQMSNVSN